MPVYEVELDDGRTVEIEGDRQPTHDEVYGLLKDYKPTPKEPEFQSGLLSPKERGFSMYDVPGLVDKLSQSPLPTYGMDVPTESVPVALAKTVAGLGRGVVSPLGAGATALGPVEAAGPALKAGFGALGTKGLADIAAQQITTPEARPKTIPQAVELAGQVLPQLAMAAAPFADVLTTKAKGAADALKERIVQESVSTKRPGDDALRVPPETGVSGGIQPEAPVQAKAKPLTKEEREFQLLRENWLPTIKPWRQKLLDQEVAEGQGGRNIETNFSDSPGARDVERAKRYYELARKLYGREPVEEVAAAAYTNPETGQTTTAPNHIEAAEKQGVEAPQERSARETKDYGFEVQDKATGQTEVVSRDDAEKIARESGQLKEEPKSDKVHSDEIALAPKVPTPPQGAVTPTTAPSLSPEQAAVEQARLASELGEEAPAPIPQKTIAQGLQRIFDEQLGRQMLDTLDVEGKSPQEVVSEFWSKTYPNLPTEIQQRFQRILKKETSFKPGDKIGVDAQGQPITAKDWPDTYPATEATDQIKQLTGTERGLIAMMETANRNRDILSKQAPPPVIEGEAQPTVPAAGKAEGGVSAPPAPAIPEGGISPAKVQVSEQVPERVKIANQLSLYGDRLTDATKVVAKHYKESLKGRNITEQEVREEIGNLIRKDREGRLDNADERLYANLAQKLQVRELSDLIAKPEKPAVKEGPLTPAESTRLKSLTEKMESGKPLTSAEQKRWKALKEKASGGAVPEEKAAVKAEVEVQKVAATEGQRPAKEVKDELVDRLEKALELSKAEGEKPTWVEIDIPGDGSFKIGNTPKQLSEVLESAKRIKTSPTKPAIESRRLDAATYLRRDVGDALTVYGTEANAFQKLSAQLKRGEELGIEPEQAKRIRKLLSKLQEYIETPWRKAQGRRQIAEDRVETRSERGMPPLSPDSPEVKALKAAEQVEAREKAKVDAILRPQPPTTPPSTGEGMVGPGVTELYAGVPVGLDKFIESDLKPLLKKGVDATKALSDVIVNWFSPATHAKGRDVDVLFESKGYAEQFKTKAAAAVEQANRMMGKLPEKEQIDFIDRVKRGESQTTPELQMIADLLRKWDDRLYQEAKVYKPGLNYLDNHLRVLWKVVPGSPEAIGMSKTSIGSKRPWRGSQGFTRRHVLEDMSEGLDLGGVPVTHNPVEMFLLHAQDVMKFVSANRAWEALKRTGSVEFVREGKKAPEGFRRFDDPIAKPYFRTEEGLKAKPGEWWVDDGTARMLHNYLSRDYIRTGKFGPAGRGLLALKNATTAIELGLSPFHAVFESNETMASSLGLGLAKMASGKAKEGIKDIVSAGVSPVTTAKLGGAAIRYAKDEVGFEKNYPEAYKWFTQKYPEARQMIKDLFTGGGQVSMHEDYRIRARKGFEKAVAEGNYPGAVLRAIPALSELANKPLFETYIPRLKVGMFLREYSFELERNSEALASGKITREALARKTWSFVEDRFGELNWDNLYWDRTFKTAMQLMFRSVTWKLGNIRGFGKAGRDIASEVGTKGTGDPIQMVINQLSPPKGAAPKVTLPMAWVAGTALITAIQSSIISKVSTGKYPWELAGDAEDLIKNLTFPRIDAKDPSQRVSIPTYLRDAVHMKHDPIGYVRSSMTGTWGRIADDWQNKDFYGRPVYNPLDPVQKRVADQFQHLIPVPFAVSSYQAATKTGASTEKALAGFAGFTKAPGYISPSASSQVYDMAEKWMAQSDVPAVREKARRQAVKEQRRSDEPSDYQNLRMLLKAGDLKGAKAEYDKLLTTHKYQNIEASVKPFKPFTGNYSTEAAFVNSLTPAQKAIYESARDERITVYKRFFQMFR